MLDRRNFLRGAAGALVLGTAFGCELGPPDDAVSAGPTTTAGTAPVTGPDPAVGGLPLRVVNNSGRFPSADITLCIVGTDLATGQQVYVDAAGAAHPVAGAAVRPDGFADIAIPLSATGDTLLGLPHMSGRIYVAIGEQLRTKVVTDGAGNTALQYPAGWVETDPNFPILHDCVEFTHNDAGMFANTTMVDMLSVPLAIALEGARSQTTGRLLDGGRDAIFAALAAEPDFAGLVVDDTRVIAPGHGLDAGRFSPTYLDPHVAEVWSAYQGTDLRVATNAGTFSGRVQGDSLVFDGGVTPIARPTTRDVLFCDGALAAPNDGLSGPVAAIVAAGLNRSVLLGHPDQPVTDPAAYYSTPLTNHYARVLHEHTVDGRAYGFAFDDVCEHASYIQDTAPTSFTVELTPF